MLRLALRLAGKSRATLQTPDLTEVFPALGMRNGWKYLIANLTTTTQNKTAPFEDELLTAKFCSINRVGND